MPKVLPGFRREKPKKQIPWKQIFVGILVAIIFLGLIYLLFFSAVFKIQDVELSGANSADQNIILQMVKQNAVGKNIFLWDKNTVENEIYSQYPLISTVSVYKGLPNAIKVVLQNTTPVIDWQTGGQTYLIDQNGKVIKQAAQNGLIKVVDLENLAVNPGDEILPQFFINFLNDFLTATKKTNLKIDHFEVSESLYDLSAVTNKNIKLILSPERNPSDMLQQYQQATGKVGLPQQYIDLRFPNRVFVK
jgi:cell division septal protein FtsQ